MDNTIHNFEGGYSAGVCAFDSARQYGLAEERYQVLYGLLAIIDQAIQYWKGICVA